MRVPLAQFDGAISVRIAAADRSPLPAAARVRSSTTSAPPAADCGRRPMAERPGTPSPTARFTVPRSARVAVAPSNPDVVYIGTGEADIRGNITAGRRRLQVDRRRQDLDAHRSRCDAEHLQDPRRPDEPRSSCYVAAFGHHAAPNPDRGVFRSKDGGKTWEKILFRDDRTGAIELIIDPNNPRIVLYAALWEAFRNAHMMSSGGPGSGLFKSTDGGDHWTEISRNPGLPEGHAGQDRARRLPRRLQPRLRTDRSRRRRALHVRRCGRDVEAGDARTVTSVSAPSTTRACFADPKEKDTVYELNVGFMKSTDAGKTWTQLRPPHGDNHDMWIDPSEPGAMIEANDGGANVSVNGGETWTGPGLPDGAVLPRDHDNRHAVSRLRRAAGQLDGLRRASAAGWSRRRGRRGRSRFLHRRRRRERLHRRRIRGTPNISMPAATAA